MRVSFGLDEESRTIYFTPKDPLEIAILDHIAELCSKGVSMKLTKPYKVDTKEYKVEVRLDGKIEQRVRETFTGSQEDY